MEIIKNKEFIVEIVDQGYLGEGIAKIDNFTIFIPNAIINEKVKIVITKVTSSHAYGRVVEYIEKSNIRVEPDCNTYKRCGGCSLRHMEYEATLTLKKQIVENCLYKELKRKLEVNNVIGMETPVYYRNKLQYPIGLNKEKTPVMGVFANRSHEIIEVKECFIQNKVCQQIANDMFKYIVDNKISIYNEESKKGLVRHIVIKTGTKTNEIMVILVLKENKLKEEKELTKYLTSKYPNIKSVIKNINTQNTNVILGNKNIVLYGQEYICDTLGEFTFRISPLSFYQVNPTQTEVLYQKAIEYAELTKKEIVLDLYCGIGTISLFVAKYVKKVYGIEIVEEAVENAKENAQINEIKNAEFFAGNIENEETLEKIKKMKADVIFIDPPRKGMETSTIEALLEIEPKKIIYISCNPATLARDIKYLSEKYEIKEIQPVDLFPYTTHVECVVLLTLK